MLLKGHSHLFEVDRIATVRQEHLLEDVLEDLVRSLPQLSILLSLVAQAYTSIQCLLCVVPQHRLLLIC